MTPWTDPGLHIWSLNDAHRMEGFVRADGWFDFHPPDKWWIVPDGVTRLMAHQIPFGHYARPAQHVQFLAQPALPVWLHPDWRTATLTDPRVTEAWAALLAKPNAYAFPKGEIETFFWTYLARALAWMLAQATLQGAKEVHNYGMHLATEHEYIEQRPGFEFLIGRLLGPSPMRVTTHHGLRTYETGDGLVVLPEASPVLQSDFQYAFEPRPRQAYEPIKWELHKLQVKHARTLNALREKQPYWPWTTLEEPGKEPGQPPTTRRVSTGTLQRELWQLDAKVADTQDQLGRLQAAGQWG